MNRKKLLPVLMALCLFAVLAPAPLSWSSASTPGAGQAPDGPATDGGMEPLVPVSSGFTYQGRLQFDNVAADGQYDLEFRLYDASAGGAQVGSTNTLLNQTVSDGLFTVSLNFGNSFQGEARWLQIAVKPAGGLAYTTLSPRQPLTATPYALSLRPGAVITGTSASPLLTLDSAGSGGALTVRGTDPTYQALTALSPSNIGIYAEGGAVAAVYGRATAAGAGVKGIGNPGVDGESTVSSGIGVRGTANGGGFAVGVWGESATGFGLYGTSTSGYGVIGSSSSSNGVTGVTTSADDAEAGVVGSSSTIDATGVKGTANNGTLARGVWGG